jgi:hypothetical protein
MIYFCFIEIESNCQLIASHFITDQNITSTIRHNQRERFLFSGFVLLYRTLHQIFKAANLPLRP